MMHIILFYHSLVSDWNHGNAHFLRGLFGELKARGHRVQVYEPSNGWSRSRLLREHGEEPIAAFQRCYPGLSSDLYEPAELDLDRVLAGADLVIVHEWNDPGLVSRIGKACARRPGCVLLFHDTHHRSVSDPAAMLGYDLTHYHGVLAFGNVVRRLFVRNGWCRRAWTWHEAADARTFRPLKLSEPRKDLVWIGNWGDEERSAELHEFLIEPVRELGLQAAVYGVRYPPAARKALQSAGIEYHGWLPNYRVPEVFAQHRLTVHVPRRPYAQALPGIPTIRVFEALACGIPLISAPWNDAEGLFTPGRDFLFARDGREMKAQLARVLRDQELAGSLALNGRQAVAARHTCGHRVDELLRIVAKIRSDDIDRAARPPAREFTWQSA